MSQHTRHTRPLTDLTFSVVGAGKVGTSLAVWCAAAGAEPIAIGVRRDSDAARDLAGRLDCVTLPLERLSSAGQDLLVVAVPDPALDAVGRTLGARRQAAVALHTSGSRDASALAALTTRGSAVGSFHPLKAFPRPLYAESEARGILFGIDGDGAAQTLARRLSDAWGASTVEVPPHARLAYHFAATLAAGGVVTLIALAAELAERAGLPGSVLDGYLELARGALRQVEAAPAPGAALTGPVVRGDRDTVLSEIEAVERVAPEVVPLVVQLARQSLRQRERWGHRSERAGAEEPAQTQRELDRELAALLPAEDAARGNGFA